MARRKLDRELVRGLLRKIMAEPNTGELVAALNNKVVHDVMALSQVNRDYLDDLLYCVAHGAPVATEKPKMGRPAKVNSVEETSKII